MSKINDIEIRNIEAHIDRINRCDEKLKFVRGFEDGQFAYIHKGVINTIAPSTELLMKVFRIFDKHGLIRDDLCFDPELFMETVVREHWNDYDF